MADDRPLEDPTSSIAALQQQVDDMNTTLQSRTARMPTGFIQPWIGTIAPTNSVLMQGQALSRTTYAVLWQWVQDQSIVGANLPFGVGDGNTTFTVPDLRDRFIMGASATQAIGTLFGTNAFPQHAHGFGSLATGSDSHKHDHTSTHTHGIPADGGNHAFHNAGADTIASALPGYQDFFHSVASSTGAGNPGHAHSNNTTSDGVYTHTTDSHNHTMSGSTDNGPGTGTTVDNRPSSIALNWILWT